MEFMRSAMFVPGHRQRFIDKALGGLPADVFLLDLEDGVPPAEKPTGRALLAEALGRPRGASPTLRYVRVNAIGSAWLEADLEAVVRPGLDGLCLPKVDYPEQVQQVDALVAARERAAGLPAGSIRYIVAIESPRGLLNAAAIGAASPRVAALMFGAEDFGRELGLPTRREGEASRLLYARSALVVAAAAANVQVIDGVWPDIQDTAGLAADCQLARQLGFTGKSLIHPGQLDIINAAFSPTPEEVDYAQRVVQAFEAAMARGEGSIAFGGQLIDLPIVERARRTLALAARLAERA
ncbi:MAG TPA: CoA ester lyase [Chloroflexota bacterium]|nr:CoA ester lyase [Chloroflexota bacterium]HZU06586.1 CoA ester lyase [Chloroflexota bacterium]